jgi:hypothetical protein
MKRKKQFISSIGENAETLRKALSDKRVQDAFIAAIDEDPQLIEVLAKVTPIRANVAADWSCCRGYKARMDFEETVESAHEMVESMHRRPQPRKERARK